MFDANFEIIMQGHSDFNDTIIAIATPPGIGAIGVLRLSGKKRLKLAIQFLLIKIYLYRHRIRYMLD